MALMTELHLGPRMIATPIFEGEGVNPAIAVAFEYNLRFEQSVDAQLKVVFTIYK
ncbi:MAG: hypothetical protein ACTSRH_12220 [Promethearchaeota archaeon]